MTRRKNYLQHIPYAFVEQFNNGVISLKRIYELGKRYF